MDSAFQSRKGRVPLARAAERVSAPASDPSPSRKTARSSRPATPGRGEVSRRPLSVRGSRTRLVRSRSSGGTAVGPILYGRGQGLVQQGRVVRLFEEPERKAARITQATAAARAALKVNTAEAASSTILYYGCLEHEKRRPRKKIPSWTGALLRRRLRGALGPAELDGRGKPLGLDGRISPRPNRFFRASRSRSRPRCTLESPASPRGGALQRAAGRDHRRLDRGAPAIGRGVGLLPGRLAMPLERPGRGVRPGARRRRGAGEPGDGREIPNRPPASDPHPGGLCGPHMGKHGLLP